MAIVSYADLQASFRTPADRAYYFTKYQYIYGSQAVPVRVLDVLGATPRGCGTYCWSDGASEMWIRGDFSDQPSSWASKGTVCISQANYTITSPTWYYDPHYDYSRNAEHEIAHLHPSSEEKWSMHVCPEKVLGFLREGISEEFARFLTCYETRDNELPLPAAPSAL